MWPHAGIVSGQVLRDKIGTAMMKKKSRADQFSLIIHGQEGEGEAKKALLGKEGAYVCVTHTVCHRSYSYSASLTLGFLLLQLLPQG